MGNLGDLNKYLSESGKITDYSWLDIDPKDYKNMPFNPIPEYVAVPKLEEQWKHLKDTNINLVPNVDLDYNYKTPDNKEKNQDALNLLDHIKKQMMSGKTGKELVEDIYTRSTPAVIRIAMDRITNLLQEQGLLGNVYVDPTVFNKCVDGATFTDKKAKTAKYVKRMAECSGCINNKQGRCEVYRKVLASEIVYDEKLLNFYSKHFSSLKGKEIIINSKSELKKAFLERPNKDVKSAEFKPVEMPQEKTLEEKEKEFSKQYAELADELSKFPKDKVSKDISSLLIKGYSGKVIKDYISKKYSKEDIQKNKSVFENILSKQGSLGKIYIDANLLPFNNCFEAKEFFNKNASGVKYIISEENFCKCHGKSPCQCRNLNKQIVPNVESIPSEVWSEELGKYPTKVVDKISSIFKKNKIQGLRLAFLSNDLIKESYEKTENYDLKSTLDSTNYSPKTANKIVLTNEKIAYALKKGHKLSSIMNIGKKAGMTENSLKEIFAKILTTAAFPFYKYQIDIPIEMPKNTIISQKDVSIDMKKTVSNIPDFMNDSSSAPIDNLITSLGIQSSKLEVGTFAKKKSDLEITGLDEFNIE